MPNLRLGLARSEHPHVRASKSLYRRIKQPAPRALVRPALWFFLVIRSACYVVVRLLICAPIFRASCKAHGRAVKTGTYTHWIKGSGDLVVGDDVLIDGKCSIRFASRFSLQPTFRVGSRTGIGHGWACVIGKSITIGDECRIAGGVWIFDSNDHPGDPTARLAGLPPPEAEVRPVVIGNQVWIGARAIIHPGVTIGDGSVVSAGAGGRADVQPFSVVAGNPARKMAALRPNDAPESSTGTEQRARGAPFSESRTRSSA